MSTKPNNDENSGTAESSGVQVPRKEAVALNLQHVEANDAHCLECSFEMIGGRQVGLCPRCGSDRWYRTELPRKEGKASLAREVTSDTEAYMKKNGWEQMSRIDVRSMWRVAVDVIEEMEMHKDCVFTWSQDRKAIIVWRNDR